MDEGALSIRDYRPADEPQVREVDERAFDASSFDLVEDSPADEELSAVSETYLGGEGTFLVGEVDGTVAAVGGYREVDEETVEIGHMRVHPDHQRRGYARTILDELEARARAAGHTRAVLETHEDLDAAIALYEDAGYDVSKTVDHEATGDVMIHYEKPL